MHVPGLLLTALLLELCLHAFWPHPVDGVLGEGLDELFVAGEGWEFRVEGECFADVLWPGDVLPRSGAESTAGLEHAEAFCHARGWVGQEEGTEVEEDVAESGGGELSVLCWGLDGANVSRMMDDCLTDVPEHQL